jgi:hypothetical protein
MLFALKENSCDTACRGTKASQMRCRDRNGPRSWTLSPIPAARMGADSLEQGPEGQVVLGLSGVVDQASEGAVREFGSQRRVGHQVLPLKHPEGSIQSVTLDGMERFGSMCSRMAADIALPFPFSRTFSRALCRPTEPRRDSLAECR